MTGFPTTFHLEVDRVDQPQSVFPDKKVRQLFVRVNPQLFCSPLAVDVIDDALLLLLRSPSPHNPLDFIALCCPARPDSVIERRDHPSSAKATTREVGAKAWRAQLLARPQVVKSRNRPPIFPQRTGSR